MARHRPTPEDHQTARTVVLTGLADGLALGEIARLLEPLHPRYDTFPGEVLLELAADAIEESGASRAAPLETDGIRRRLLPEDGAHTRAQHYKIEFALRASAMVRAGVDPDLLNAAAWHEDDLWWWALEALVIYVRAASERTGMSVREVCRRLAERNGIALPLPADS